MEEQPILAVDVDGVISLFGFESPPPPSDVDWQLVDGSPHCISIAAGERLRRLDRRFDLVWATGWQDRANDRLSQLIGVGPLPVIEFSLPPAPATEIREEPGDESRLNSTAGHWKLDALDRFAGSRPIAWIDDSLDDSCLKWAEAREGAGLPTLLVPTEPELGIEEAHVGALEWWAERLEADRLGRLHL